MNPKSFIWYRLIHRVITWPVFTIQQFNQWLYDVGLSQHLGAGIVITHSPHQNDHLQHPVILTGTCYRKHSTQWTGQVTNYRCGSRNFWNGSRLQYLDFKKMLAPSLCCFLFLSITSKSKPYAQKENTDALLLFKIHIPNVLNPSKSLIRGLYIL